MEQKIKIANLEAIRGIAAFLVFIGHVVSKIPSLAKHKNHFTNLFVNWGTECVFLFFILSGIVVHLSYDKRNKKSSTFIKHRAIRLYPTLLIALLISIPVEYSYSGKFPSVNTITGNLFPYATMSDYLAPLMWFSNPPVWSLTFEVFFYLFFALVLIPTGKINYKASIIFFFIGIVAIYFYYHKINHAMLDHFILMCSFLPIWLIGFFCYWFRNRIYSDVQLALFSTSILPIISRLHITSDYYDPIKFIVFSITSVPLFILLLNNKRSTGKHRLPVFISLVFILSFSIILMAFDNLYNKSSKTLYSIMPIIVLSLTFISQVVVFIKYLATKYLIPFFSLIGHYSYSIYLIHTPIIFFTIKKINTSPAIQVTIIIFSTLLISLIIENFIQPYINKKLI